MCSNLLVYSRCNNARSDASVLSIKSFVYLNSCLYCIESLKKVVSPKASAHCAVMRVKFSVLRLQLCFTRSTNKEGVVRITRHRATLTPELPAITATDYCPRSLRKMPHRRATDTEPMDRILL